MSVPGFEAETEVSDNTLLQILCSVTVTHNPGDRMTTLSASGLVLEDPEQVMEMSVFLLAASGSYLSSPLPSCDSSGVGQGRHPNFPSQQARPWQTGCSSEHSAENMSFSLLAPCLAA